MANNLDDIIPILIRDFAEVGREYTTFEAVSTGFGEESAAVGQSIEIPYAAPVTGADFAESMTPSLGADRTVATKTISLTKNRTFRFYLGGEDWKKLSVQGANYQSASIKQAVRACYNEVWAEVVGQAKYSSGATGTAGSTPFQNSSIAEATAAKVLLDKSLAPTSDRYLLYGTDAEANILMNDIFLKYLNSGDTSMLRQGHVGNFMGFNASLCSSVGAVSTGSTGESYVLDGAHTVGNTKITVKTGSGTIVAGDVITIGNYKYVVKTGISAPGELEIQPTSQDGTGLLAAGANGAAVTVSDAYAANLALQKGAIGLVARPSAMPEGGDAASDYTTVSDPVSGLTAGLAVYKGHGLVQYELQLAFGAAMLRPEWSKIILG